MTNFLLELPYEGKPCRPAFQHRLPTFCLHMEIIPRKKSYFGHRVFIFVLPIRNKSPFSGKIITSFKIERMKFNLLAIWPKHKIEMQTIYDGRKVQIWEFVSQGMNIGKWSTGRHCDEVAVVKKNVKTIMCQEGGTLPLSGRIFWIVFLRTKFWMLSFHLYVLHVVK